MNDTLKQKELYFLELDSYKNLKKGWDSYDAETPSQHSIIYSKKIIDFLFQDDIYNISICPDAEGGVYIEFSIEKKIIILNIYNKGKSTIYQKGDIHSIKEFHIQSYRNIIREFL